MLACPLKDLFLLDIQKWKKQKRASKKMILKKKTSANTKKRIGPH